MDDFYKLLPLIFKTPNRINSMLFKNDKLEYFKNNGVIELYEKYKELFANSQTLSLFLYERYIQPYPRVKTDNACVVCGNETKFRSFAKGFNKSCCVLCNTKSDERKRLEVETNFRKYGHKTPMKVQSIKDKQRANFLKIPKEQRSAAFLRMHEKFKNNPNLKSEFYRKIAIKVKNTKSQNPEISKRSAEKYRNTCMKLWNVPNSSQKHMKNMADLNEKYWRENFIIDGFFYNYKAMIHHNVAASVIYTYKRKFNISEVSPLCKLQISQAEKHFLSILKQTFPNFIYFENDRTLIKNPHSGKFLEIDILIKRGDNILCGVEYNGIYYHDKENPVKEELKTRLCEELGFPLFHIWEDTVESDFKSLSEFLLQDYIIN